MKIGISHQNKALVSSSSTQVLKQKACMRGGSAYSCMDMSGNVIALDFRSQANPMLIAQHKNASTKSDGVVSVEKEEDQGGFDSRYPECRRPSDIEYYQKLITHDKLRKYLLSSDVTLRERCLVWNLMDNFGPYGNPVFEDSDESKTKILNTVWKIINSKFKRIALLNPGLFGCIVRKLPKGFRNPLFKSDSFKKILERDSFRVLKMLEDPNPYQKEKNHAFIKALCFGKFGKIPGEYENLFYSEILHNPNADKYFKLYQRNKAVFLFIVSHTKKFGYAAEHIFKVCKNRSLDKGKDKILDMLAIYGYVDGPRDAIWAAKNILGDMKCAKRYGSEVFKNVNLWRQHGLIDDEFRANYLKDYKTYGLIRDVFDQGKVKFDLATMSAKYDGKLDQLLVKLSVIGGKHVIPLRNRDIERLLTDDVSYDRFAAMAKVVVDSLEKAVSRMPNEYVEEVQLALMLFGDDLFDLPEEKINLFMGDLCYYIKQNIGYDKYWVYEVLFSIGQDKFARGYILKNGFGSLIRKMSSYGSAYHILSYFNGNPHKIKYFLSNEKKLESRKIRYERVVEGKILDKLYALTGDRRYANGVRLQEDDYVLGYICDHNWDDRVSGLILDEAHSDKLCKHYIDIENDEPLIYSIGNSSAFEKFLDRLKVTSNKVSRSRNTTWWPK